MIFANRKTQVLPRNTFIGGVSSFINTPELLAAKLNNYPSATAFSPSNIKDFTVVGSDIECLIEVDYQLIQQAFVNSTTIKSYKDEGNKCKKLNIGVFQDAVNFEYLKIEGVLSINSNCFSNVSKMKLFYFPNLTEIISSSTFFGVSDAVLVAPKLTPVAQTVGNDNLFSGTQRLKFYTNKANQTINGGNPDGEITDLITTRNGSVVYIENETNPSPVSDLRAGNIYATAVQLIFTQPSSANAIDYYDVFVNGKLYKKIFASGDYVSGLNPVTSYTFNIVPIDIYYNKSSSNTVSGNTISATNYIDSIQAYYRMQNSVKDSFKNNHGIPTSISYEAGTVGQRAVFNGSSSKVTIPDDFNFTVGFSVVFIVKFDTNPNGTIKALIVKDQNSPNREFIIDYFNTGFRVLLWDNEGRNLQAITSTSITTGQDYIIAYTFNGGVVASGLKIYINGSEATTSKTENASFTGLKNTNAQIEFGFWSVLSGRTLNGSLDEIPFFNKELTASEVLEITNKLQLGQSLI